MYKVVIVDDEDIIVKGLLKVVEWDKFNCQVVATAHDAKSGASAIREHHPDILFTDIKMPDMDGLTMITGLKSDFPDMQITVLTGHRDFDYAKKAINLSVARFLMKPSKMNEIQEALTFMTTNLDKINHIEHKDEVKEEPLFQVEESSNSKNSYIVRCALDYIEANYYDKLTLTELAEKNFVSPWYLSKLLNKYTNKSFCELLNLTRIKKAKELLKQPDLKIYQISEMTGFSDVTHFSKIFKKIEEVSPNEYRNTILTKQ